MNSLPVELLRQIIPDIDAAVELGATCKWLRAALPADLFVLRELVDNNKYFRRRFPALHKVRRVLIVDGINSAIIPVRAAYLRYVYWTGDEYHRARSFTAAVDGIIPSQDHRYVESAGLLVMQDGNTIKHVFGGLEWLTVLAANCSCDSTLFVLKGKSLPETSAVWEVGHIEAFLIGAGFAAFIIAAVVGANMCRQN